MTALHRGEVDAPELGGGMPGKLNLIWMSQRDGSIGPHAGGTNGITNVLKVGQ